jgi:hypothetical protein
LSQNRAICVSGNQRSLRAVCNQRECFAAVERAIYLASIDVDIDVYCCDRQEIVEFPSFKQITLNRSSAVDTVTIVGITDSSNEYLTTIRKYQCKVQGSIDISETAFYSCHILIVWSRGKLR